MNVLWLIKNKSEQAIQSLLRRGRSVIIGFQKTQIYQRFAGSQQEVFILNCARNNINFCNYIPQTIITKHIFKSIVSCIAYFFCLRSVCLINRYFIIGSISG